MEGTRSRKYLLLDTNIVAAYYVPVAGVDERTTLRIQQIIDSVRTKKSDFFFYIPNFCVAEVFSVLARYGLGRKKKIHARNYKSAKQDFRSDIHNGNLLYHYELSRYHVLAVDLIAPITHYFKPDRKPKNGKDRKANPIGTFDQLILAMGLHLAKTHGADNVIIVSNDERLIQVLRRAREKTIVYKTKDKIGLHEAEQLTGIKVTKDSVPRGINLQKASKKEFEDLFGTALEVGKMDRSSFRYRAFKPKKAKPATPAA